MAKAKKPTKKPRLRPFPAVRMYPLLSSVVEGGITCGIHHAFKHTETALSEDEMNNLTARVEDAVMNAICEVFDIED